MESVLVSGIAYDRNEAKIAAMIARARSRTSPASLLRYSRPYPMPTFPWI